MKIYTKTGDKGKTSLFGGKKVRKSHLRLQAYGDLDELNSSIGLVLSMMQDHADTEFKKIQSLLNEIQIELFNIGSQLACDNKKLLPKLPKPNPALITMLETSIDEMELQLSPLKNFILPGGHKLSAQTHVCRTIARRAERRIVELEDKIKIDSNIIIFINRLSDYLFVLARHFNFTFQISETPWIPR